MTDRLRRAASVLLVRGEPIEVLTIKRHGKATFGSSFVFPGGVVDPDDADEAWLRHLARADSLSVMEALVRLPPAEPRLFSSVEANLSSRSRAAALLTGKTQVQAQCQAIKPKRQQCLLEVSARIGSPLFSSATFVSPQKATEFRLGGLDYIVRSTASRLSMHSRTNLEMRAVAVSIPSPSASSRT